MLTKPKLYEFMKFSKNRDYKTTHRFIEKEILYLVYIYQKFEYISYFYKGNYKCSFIVNSIISTKL